VLPRLTKNSNTAVAKQLLNSPQDSSLLHQGVPGDDEHSGAAQLIHRRRKTGKTAFTVVDPFHLRGGE
jgi:hypothetical protein